MDLDGFLLKKVQTVFVLLHAVNIMQYLMILIGCGCVAIAVYFRLKTRKSVTITPTSGCKKGAPSNGNEKMDISRLSIAGILGDRPERKSMHKEVLSGHAFDKY